MSQWYTVIGLYQEKVKQQELKLANMDVYARFLCYQGSACTLNLNLTLWSIKNSLLHYSFKIVFLCSAIELQQLSKEDQQWDAKRET